MVNLNVHSLIKLYGTEKLSYDAFRYRLIKFLIGESLKSSNILLPPVISRKIGKYNGIEGYMRDIFLLTSQLQKGGIGKDQLNLVLCVTNYLYKKLKYQPKILHFGVKIVPNHYA